MHRGARVHYFIYIRVLIRNVTTRLPPVLSLNAHTDSAAVKCMTERNQDKAHGDGARK